MEDYMRTSTRFAITLGAAGLFGAGLMAAALPSHRVAAVEPEQVTYTFYIGERPFQITGTVIPADEPDLTLRER
jgi:hypothetical protein